MPLFKNKQPDNPKPPDGQDPPDPNNPDDPKPPEYVTMEQLNTSLSKFADTLTGAIGKQQEEYQQRNASPPPPPEDPHKESKARIAAIDGELDNIEAQIDEAVIQGKTTKGLFKRQRALTNEQADLRAKVNTPTGDPRIDAGIHTLDALTTEVLSSKMPYLSIEAVKKSYEKYVNQLPPEQRMNPEAKKGCYNLAVGENYVTVEEVKKQEWLREQENPPSQDPPPGSPGGRQQPGGAPPADDTSPENYFSPAGLQMIRESKHRTPENYVQSLGYRDWDDYIEKTREPEEEPNA